MARHDRPSARTETLPPDPFEGSVSSAESHTSTDPHDELLRTLPYPNWLGAGLIC